MMEISAEKDGNDSFNIDETGQRAAEDPHSSAVHAVAVYGYFRLSGLGAPTCELKTMLRFATTITVTTTAASPM